MSIQQFTSNSVNILPTICKAPGLNKTFLPLATSIWLQSPSQPPWPHKCGLHVISCFLWPWFILDFCRSFCYILKIQLSFSYACVMLNPLTPACRTGGVQKLPNWVSFLFLRVLNYGGTLYKSVSSVPVNSLLHCCVLCVDWIPSCTNKTFKGQLQQISFI